MEIVTFNDKKGSKATFSKSRRETKKKMNFINLPTLVKIKIIKHCDFYSKIYLRIVYRTNNLLVITVIDTVLDHTRQDNKLIEKWELPESARDLRS